MEAGGEGVAWMISRYVGRGWIRGALCSGPQGLGAHNLSCSSPGGT